MGRKIVSGRCACRKCGATFDAPNMATGYCSACRDTLCSRICSQCDTVFHVDEPWDERTTCSRDCRQAAAWKARRANYHINPPVVKLLAVSRTCRRCDEVFIAEQLGTRYCPKCRDVLVNRTCVRRHCGRKFHPQSPSSKQIYCSEECSTEAHRERGKMLRPPCRNSIPLVQCQYGPCGKKFSPTHGNPNRFCSQVCWNADRRDRAKRVRCAWTDCPRPDDLLRPYEQKYHPECWQAYRGKPSTPPTATRPCDACEQPITYRLDRKHRPKIHAACRGAYMRAQPKKGEERPCEQCDALVYRFPWELATARHVFCSRECGVAWKRVHGDELPIAHVSAIRASGKGKRLEIRCVVCSHTRQYLPSGFPASANRETMTWTCPDCRPRGSMARVITCANPKCRRQVWRQIKDFDPAKPYHCSVACRSDSRQKAGKKLLARRTCPICYQEYQKGQRSFAKTRFTITRSRARTPLPQGGRRCCGREHARLYRAQVMERQQTCPICDLVFLPIIKDQIYCGKKCAGVGRKGKPIVPRRWRAEMKDKVCTMWRERPRSYRLLAEEFGIDWRTVKQYLMEEGLIETAVS